ncbi:MAG: hypothetical protein ACRYFA_03870 [Janthinobacterium lividum]
MKQYVALIKFSKYHHIVALRDEGHLHCETLNYFSKLEDNSVRGDKFETISEMRYMENFIVKFKNVGAPDSDYRIFKGINGNIFNSEENMSNIFCLYSLRFKSENLKQQYVIPEECKGIADSYLVITDPKEFLIRIQSTLEKLKLNGRYGFVAYKDFSKFTGKKTYFEKDIHFSPQNEFRILIDNISSSVLDIKIGSIADISHIGYCNDLDSISFYDNEDKT